MSFALNPDGGLPRVIRFVPERTLPSDTTLSVLDIEKNLLLINVDRWNDLTTSQQHELVKTRSRFVEVENRDPFA